MIYVIKIRNYLKFFLFLIVAPAGGGCQTMDTSRYWWGGPDLAKCPESGMAKMRVLGVGGEKSSKMTKKGVF